MGRLLEDDFYSHGDETRFYFALGRRWSPLSQYTSTSTDEFGVGMFGGAPWAGMVIRISPTTWSGNLH